MKRVPVSLTAFWAANPECHRVHLFAIGLPTGQTLYATDGQWDVTLKTSTPGWGGPQTTFKARDYGVWSRGPITSEASTKPNSNTMSLTCVAQQDTAYPGTPLGILAAAHAHLFDGATVWVYAVYMPLGAYGDVSAGIEIKFHGTVTRVPGLGRTKVEFECADPFYLLNNKVPTKLMQSNCPWSFCDVNCTLAKADFTIPVINADNGSTQAEIIAFGTWGQPNGYLNQGVVKCTSGANAGLSQTVKSNVWPAITLSAPWPLPVALGDSFSAIKGCDKTLSMCKGQLRADLSATVDNSAHFGGTPFTPAPSQAV